MSWWLEDSWQRILRMQPLQRKPWYCQPEPAGSGQRGPQKIPLLLREGESSLVHLTWQKMKYGEKKQMVGKPHVRFWMCIFQFIFDQWENHNKSLQLEAQTYHRIQEKIQERVMNNLGTWIDWQYLHNAAKLLAKVLTPWTELHFLLNYIIEII